MILQGERSDRISRAVFGGGLWSFSQAGLRIEEIAKSPDLFAAGLADLFGELGTDIVFAGSGLNSFPAEAIGGQLAFRGEQAPLLTFPLIQKAEDAAYFAQIDIGHSLHSLALIEMIAGLREQLPDRYICATSWGPFTWAMILCDWHHLQDKVVTDRRFVQEVCDLGVRLSFSLYEPLIRRGLIDGISIPDGAVTLISNDLYREVIIPYEKKLFDMVRARGVGCFLHQCGNINQQIPLYPETGADCITVDAGVSIGDVYRLYHDRLVTAGNVDVVNTIYGGDQELICNSVAESVAGISDPLYRYILMPSCDLPRDTPIEKVKEFLSCADRIAV
ncbi:MAG: uroporphyrinogen decarboxylase family protein [Nitrospirota bacterium]|nr:uroporphyrinogen decarboxylase family protein [Nitrospirota bacterium]